MDKILPSVRDILKKLGGGFDHGGGDFGARVAESEGAEAAAHPCCARGLEVGVWTVNNEEDLEKFTALGVDYIESDVFGG